MERSMFSWRLALRILSRSSFIFSTSVSFPWGEGLTGGEDTAGANTRGAPDVDVLGSDPLVGRYVITAITTITPAAAKDKGERMGVLFLERLRMLILSSRNRLASRG